MMAATPSALAGFSLRLAAVFVLLSFVPSGHAQCPYQKQKPKQKPTASAPSQPPPPYKAQYRRVEGKKEQQKWY